MLRVTSVTGLDAQELWRYLAPIQGFAIVISLLLMIPIAAIEKKNGAGMTDEEFAELKKTLSQPAKVSVSRPVLIFDMALTAFMIVGLLLGWFGTALGFIVAFGLALIVNFKSTKEQGAKDQAVWRPGYQHGYDHHRHWRFSWCHEWNRHDRRHDQYHPCSASGKPWQTSVLPGISVSNADQHHYRKR